MYNRASPKLHALSVIVVAQKGPIKEVRMKKRIAKIIITGIMIVGMVAGASAQTIGSSELQQVRMAVENLFANYIKGVESFNAELWTTNWDENGVKMVPNAPPIVGRAAIGAFARSKFVLFAYRKMCITIDKLEAADDLAIAQGTYTSDDQLKTASSITRSIGWFCTVFKKQTDGTWKILMDSVGPIPAPVAASPQTTDIFTAAKSGTAGQIEAAIKAGGKVNDRAADSKLTPLMIAAKSNPDPEAIAALIKAGANLEDRDEENSATPLMIASGWNPNPKVITVLLNAGAKIEERDKYNNKTALMFAAMYSTNPEIVLTLLKAGADGRLLSFKGLSAFDYADRNPSLKGTQAWQELSNARK